MSRLSEKEHWDFVHEKEEEGFNATVKSRDLDYERLPLKRRLILRVKQILGPEVLARMTGYGNYLLWEEIFKQHLPELKGARVLEVGSAPGEFLVQFSQRYECIPYGVEYSEVGVQLNRKMFSTHGIDPNNVIHADFFSDEFHERYRKSFDVVISRGFIEHFTDVEDVIEKHLNLLAEGGYLILSVPNFRGINYALTWILNKKLIPLHNLEIMRKAEFKKLFERADLTQLFCDYLGTFSFTLFYTEKESPLRFALNLCHKAQPALDLIFRTTLKDKGWETQLCSPSLLFIGRKLPQHVAPK